jgi:hypothetical protein
MVGLHAHLGALGRMVAGNAPGPCSRGFFIATFLGEGMVRGVAGEAWDERKFGMNVYEAGQDWSNGGPMVVHSPWWLEAHWGRLFEIERLLPFGFLKLPNEAPHNQGVLVARKTGKIASFEELELIDPDEPREATTLLHHVKCLRAEVATLRQERDALRREAESDKQHAS